MKNDNAHIYVLIDFVANKFYRYIHGIFFAVYTVVKLSDDSYNNQIYIIFKSSKSVNIEYYTRPCPLGIDTHS